MPSIMALNKNNATARYVSGGDLIREERNEIEDGMIVEKGLWPCPLESERLQERVGAVRILKIRNVGMYQLGERATRSGAT